jgi:ribosomal protein L15
VEKGLLKKLLDGVKILGQGNLSRRLTVQAQKFSGTAREKIIKAGGTCVDLPLPGVRSKAAIAEAKSSAS